MSREIIHLPERVGKTNFKPVARFRQFLFDLALGYIARSVGQPTREVTVVHKKDLQHYRDIKFGLMLDHQDPMKYVKKVEEFDV